MHFNAKVIATITALHNYYSNMPPTILYFRNFTWNKKNFNKSWYN